MLANYKAGLSTMWSEFGGDGIGSDPPVMTNNADSDRATMQVETPDYTTYSGTVDYGYDYKNELASESSTRNGGSPVDNNYDYSGNFTKLRGTTVPTANSDNQLTASGYTFDGDGSPTDYAGSTLSYDPESRLTKFVTGGTTKMQSGYGLDGLRAWATAGGNTNYFLYDNDTPVVGITSAGVVTRVNTFGANGFLASYSQNFTGGSYERYYAFDPQGNTSEMIAGTGSSGTLLLSATYDSFGKRSAYPSTYDGDVYDSFGAQWGYRVDSGTGFELLGHRFYDEANGRFVNRDPVGYDGGIDLYTHCENKPTSEFDPSGFSPGPGWCSAQWSAFFNCVKFVLPVSLGVGWRTLTPYCRGVAALSVADCFVGNWADGEVGFGECVSSELDAFECGANASLAVRNAIATALALLWGCARTANSIACPDECPTNPPHGKGK